MGLKYIFLFSLQIILIIESSLGQSFGETCVEYINCIDGTSCINNVCQCQEGHEYFEGVNSNCVIRVGAECGNSVGSWACVLGSECDTTTDTCQCTSPSIPTENGACSLGFGNYCSKNQTCTPGFNLDCLNNRCVCGDGLTTDEYNPHLDIGIAPSECKVKNQGKCTANNGPNCVQNAQCIGGECKCNSGYGDDTTGQCRKLHSQSCSSKNVHVGVHECSFARGLACVDGTCQCQEPSIWNVEKQACLAGLGESCGGSGCSDPNAICVSKHSFDFNRCVCFPGFEESQGVCIKDTIISNCGCPSQDGNTFDCTGKPCGHYPIKNDPTRFVQCTEGTGIVHSCPPPLEFNVNLSLCDMPHTSYTISNP